MTLDIIYVGDWRGNRKVMEENHRTLLERLSKLIDFKILDFTKTSPYRGNNPYDTNTSYLSGAVQLWDLVYSIEQTTGDIIFKIRTDVWFTEKAIDDICKCVEKIIQDESDIYYLGSKPNVGQKDSMDGWESSIDGWMGVIEYVIIAKRDKIRPIDLIYQDLSISTAEKKQVGNETFLWLINGSGKRNKNAIMVMTHIWLIRKYYDDYPDDWVVCRDYLQSNIENKDGTFRKSAFYDENNASITCESQLAIDWWREKQGWPPMKVTLDNLTGWQTQ